MVIDMAIEWFMGENRYLSNFWPSVILYRGKEYATVEHAYQAAKTTVEHEQERIRLMDTPGKAKRLGGYATLRPDWYDVRLPIMKELLELKFTIPELAEKLKASGKQELIEGNAWGDTFWGVCKNEGKNHLGKLLMEVRSIL